MTGNNETGYRSDEIDLMEVFRRMGASIGRSFRKLGRASMITLVFLIRNWIPLLSSLIAGLILSFLLRTTSAGFYTSDMTLKANGASASEMITYINRLHNFCTDNNKEALGAALSLDKGQADEVLDIQAFWIIDQNNDHIPDFVDFRNSHSVYDTINVRMNDRFEIRIKINSTMDLGKIRDGIISFLNSDSLFREKNSLRLIQNRELSERISADISLLDSLQKIKYFEETKARQPQNGGQMIFLQEQKTQLIYSDIQDLYVKKQTLESERVLYNDLVTVLSDLSLPARRENNTVYYGKAIVPALFIMTLLVLVLIRNRNKLKEIFSKYE